MVVRCVSAAVAGVVLSAAFEPVGLAVLLPAMIAVWALCLYGLPARRAWLPSLLFGLGFQLTLISWQRVVGDDAWLALAGLEALFLAPLGALAAALMRRRAWPVTVAVAWVAVETIRSSWPESGMPWGRLAFATADTLWQPALPWVGMTGVSLLVALTGTTLAWLVVEGRRRVRAAAGATAALAALVLLPVLVDVPVAATGTADIAAVQPDVPGAGDDLVAVHREVTDNLVEATTALADQVERGERPRPDLVVWPENSTAVDPFRDTRANAAIEQASAAIGVPLLVGTLVDGPAEDEVRNQGIVWLPPGTAEGDARFSERYTKLHPVPFGEYIPWRDTLRRLGVDDNLGRLRQIGRDMVAGTAGDPLRVGDLDVADVICFDVAYDDGILAQVGRGGELITVQTSNAFYVYTDQLDQQFEMTRLRAVETGRSVVVASTNGISAIVRPDGEVIEAAPRQVTQVLTAEVPLSTTLTPAVRLGLWTGRATVAVTALLLAWCLVGGLRSRRAGRRRTERRDERPTAGEASGGEDARYGRRPAPARNRLEPAPSQHPPSTTTRR